MLALALLADGVAFCALVGVTIHADRADLLEETPPPPPAVVQPWPARLTPTDLADAYGPIPWRAAGVVAPPPAPMPIVIGRPPVDWRWAA